MVNLRCKPLELLQHYAVGAHEMVSQKALGWFLSPPGALQVTLRTSAKAINVFEVEHVNW